jgi:hypothetical protein
LNQLFIRLDEFLLEADGNGYQLYCSYVEVYNEHINDLLNPRSSLKLKIYEDSIQGVTIMGGSEIPI